MDVREKLVELLNGVQHYGTICTMSQMDDRYARIAQVPNTEVAESLIAHGVTVQEWISVKDRLPELNEIVLAVLNEPNKRLNYPYEEKTLLLFRRGYRYITGYEEKWERPFGAETIDYNDKVTHWMPLPQPPKGE